MAFKRNPNITDRNEKALTVPCSYCHAKVGEQCWTLHSVRGQPQEQTRAPHKRRVREAVLKRFEERKAASK